MPTQIPTPNPHYTREEYLHVMGVTPKQWHIVDGPNGRRILADALLDDKEFVPGQTWASAFGLVTLAAVVNGFAVYTWTDNNGPHREQQEFWHFQRAFCLCVDGAHVPEKYRETTKA